jgi:opacity protein-like surface antigen
MKRPILGIALILALAPLAAQAQGPLYRVELTPTASYRFGGTLQGGDNALFNSDLKVEDSSAYGVTLDIPLSSRIQLELLANRQSSQLRFDQGLFGGTTGVADIDVSYYHVGMLWQWGDYRVSPFFTASLGVANLNPDVAGASSENRFSASLGGGVKVFFSDNVGLRFEGRGFFSDLGNNGNNRDRRCDYYNDSCYGNDFSQGQASIGLILAF